MGNPQNAYNQLVVSLIKEIEDCMDALQRQLNKNPNTRSNDNRNSNQEHKSSSFDSYNNNNKRRRNRRHRNEDPSVYMSKRLSFYLRHGAKKAGIKIRTDGYVQVQDLLKLNEFKRQNADFEKIKNIVDTNDKKRFSMKKEENIWLIRANQGHSIKSIKSQELLNEITLNDVDKYPVVCHGTYFKVWDIVKTEGLKTMKRNHIHFVPSDSVQGKGVISGMRYNCQLLIYIDIQYALEDGIKFFLSENNVILSSGINGKLSPKYFKKVTTFLNGKPGKIIWNKEDRKNVKND